MTKYIYAQLGAETRGSTRSPVTEGTLHPNISPIYSPSATLFDFCQKLPVLISTSVLSIKINKITKTELFSPSIEKSTMSEGNRTTTRQFVEIGDTHVSAESAIDFEDNLLCPLLDRNLSASGVDGTINAIVALLSTQIETLIRSVRELGERSPNQSIERNLASELSRSSG